MLTIDTVKIKMPDGEQLEGYLEYTLESVSPPNDTVYTAMTIQAIKLASVPVSDPGAKPFMFEAEISGLTYRLKGVYLYLEEKITLEWIGDAVN